MVTLLKKGLASTLVIATAILGSTIANPKPAEAQVLIGGGGTCAPHQAFYQQYVSGYYNSFGTWVPSHYETRSRMSTECNQPNTPFPSGLAGAWYTDANNSGATTHIVQTDPFNNYRFINEQGSTSWGYVLGNQVFAPEWGVTGTLQNNGNRIAWSNGTDWTRYG
ncbi:hypothetical protein K9N68_27765 [Kovacikia minuta CCNUW1]|uniref:hypothetical protein n=1 Tax=Kovacikia minuta TaxID=2931930 RepID=UPI001CCC63DE|nr:hypothetical protein [Kovacikia minuta]UBF25363.1 hypothetical protein K9N68_27765 [Kovacikia minuta CCNUW1]